MGTYRTLHTSQVCPRCANTFPCQIQFKTDEDWLEEYLEADAAKDLALHAEFEGITDLLCLACDKLRVLALIDSYREGLCELALRGDVEVQVANRVSIPDLALALRDEFASLTRTVQPHRTGEYGEVPGYPPLPQSIRILCSAKQEWPPLPGTNIWTVFKTPFWSLLSARVLGLMEQKGWSAYRETTRDVWIVVGQDHRLLVRPFEGPSSADG